MSVPGLSEEDALRITNKYGRERVFSAVRQLKGSQQYKSGGVSNIGAYVRAIIRNDRKVGRPLPKDPVVEMKRVLREDVRGRYARYESGAVFEICRSLPNKTKRELEVELLGGGKSFHKRNTVAILSRGGGLDNPILYDHDSGGAIAFLRSTRPDLLDSVLDQKAFSKKAATGAS